MPTKTKTLTVRLPLDLYQASHEVAKRRRISFNALVQEGLNAIMRAEHYPLPEQPIIAEYLRGQIPRKRFVAMVGGKPFHVTWERLTAEIHEITQKAKQRQTKALLVNESTSLMITGVANSFLLWNLPDSYGAGPIERVQVVDGSIWVFPIVLTSPGYGIVGEVGQIAVDINKEQVIGCTSLDTVQQHGKKCYERHKKEIKAAFLQARRT